MMLTVSMPAKRVSQKTPMMSFLSRPLSKRQYSNTLNGPSLDSLFHPSAFSSASLASTYFCAILWGSCCYHCLECQG